MVYCLALTLWCIKIGYRTPDILFPVYPATDMNPKGLSPKLITEIDSPMFGLDFLMMCINVYLPDDWHDPMDNIFISPVLASGEFLSRLPPIWIFTGEDDVLVDDNIRFLHKLL